MPNINAMRSSKYLKKEDVGEEGTIVTIVNVHQMNVAMENDPEELKWVLVTKEFEKPMVLNSTCAQLIAKFTGSEETEEWTGKQVVLYDEPNVSFGGKLVGGIRVRRAPTPGAARSAPRTIARKDDDGTDDVPWPAE